MNNQDVDFKHPAYNKFIKEWQMIDDCVAGEREIKRKKEAYLPRPNEAEGSHDEERYNKYLFRASFINATGRTLSGLIGIAFNKPPKIELKGALSILTNDADGEGQPLEQFARDCLSQALRRGRAGIFTDYTGGGEQTTLTKGRTVLRLFNAKQIINWRVTKGKTTLVVLKYEEPAETDDFKIDMVTKWIELRVVGGVAHARHWEMTQSGVTVTGFIPLNDSKGKPLNELPWAWIGASNNDHTPDNPPLSDIAYTNIKHYQLEADIAEAAHIVGCPMVAITGLTADWADRFLKKGFVVGSRDGVTLPAGGDLKYVQPEDRNLVIKALERKEEQLAKLGAKLVERNSSARTATQAGDEAQTDNSILSLCAGNVEHAINKALLFAQQFEGGGEGSVELNKRYDIVNLDSQAITALMAAVQGGKMRLIDFIRYQQRVGLVPQNDDPETIIEELEISNQNLTV
ncbi:DUF4055 domain-containing protein [Utexia brackfieldae]|uniref:DUF4055 domain-containing protein n=1 Tax=Utexia brackfieldae TaxID=3074108 RepID=UPI00370DB578